jgi:hypothetical protein
VYSSIVVKVKPTVGFPILGALFSDLIPEATKVVNVPIFFTVAIPVKYTREFREHFVAINVYLCLYKDNILDWALGENSLQEYRRGRNTVPRAFKS